MERGGTGEDLTEGLFVVVGVAIVVMIVIIVADVRQQQ